MERTERDLTEQLRSRIEGLHARAFLVDDSGAYRAGIEDALAELTAVLERPATSGGPPARRRRA
ncbi:MAG: hypothetical protein KY457_02255 [Actinobacteria bacterium]|nr:hypothetical protein [Actinomycetota bacterium]